MQVFWGHAGKVLRRPITESLDRLKTLNSLNGQARPYQEIEAPKLALAKDWKVAKGFPSLPSPPSRDTLWDWNLGPNEEVGA